MKTVKSKKAVYPKFKYGQKVKVKDPFFGKALVGVLEGYNSIHSTYEYKVRFSQLGLVGTYDENQLLDWNK